MSDKEVLEPSLLPLDLKILRAIPPDPLHREENVDGASIWTLGERTDLLDLEDLLRTLRGLEHLGYAFSSSRYPFHRRVWWRTEKGMRASTA